MNPMAFSCNSKRFDCNTVEAVEQYDNVLFIERIQNYMKPSAVD